MRVLHQKYFKDLMYHKRVKCIQIQNGGKDRFSGFINPNFKDNTFESFYLQNCNGKYQEWLEREVHFLSICRICRFFKWTEQQIITVPFRHTYAHEEKYYIAFLHCCKIPYSTIVLISHENYQSKIHFHKSLMSLRLSSMWFG